MFQKGSWVCWKTFTAEPLNVLLIAFQTIYKSLPWSYRILPIKHAKEPLCKGWKAHSTGFSIQY
jgi:hypothetical protein